jgi:hypothetical protein
MNRVVVVVQHLTLTLKLVGRTEENYRNSQDCNLDKNAKLGMLM